MRLPLLTLLCLSLAACSVDPLGQVDTLDEVAVAEDAGQADALPDAGETDLLDVEPPVTEAAAPPQGGLLGFLKRRADAAQADETAPVEAEAVAAGPEPETIDQTVEAAPADVEQALALLETEEPKSREPSLFGRLFGNNKGSEAAEVEPEKATEPEAVQLAALSPEEAAPEPAPEIGVEPEKRGLFGLLRKEADEDIPEAAPEPSPGAPDYAKVGPGVTLPYGEVARLCGVSPRSLGKKAESFPNRGGYTLYDSKPGSTGVRNFYLSGFDDGCLRQFSAALVMFGSVETYEQIHYGAPGATLPRGATDVAYEKLKGRLCGVAAGKPCGAKRSRLAGNTAFVSVYERFESTGRWSTLLVHDGEVLAVDTKG